MFAKVAVIVPLYKQSQYLTEAVISAASQACRPIVVIVNDGCPEPESDDMSRFLMKAFPEQVMYLREPNGGLSSARNVGVRYILKHKPNTEFFFFLDADNVLGDNFLEVGLKQFERAPDAGWVYFSLRTFGHRCRNWIFSNKFNYYRQFFENQCDAGSIVRRALFDNGLFFDETMRSGYEDWEFFLRAAGNGFYGVGERSAQFFYRVKYRSMVTEAVRSHGNILNSIYHRHRDRLKPGILLKSEHRHCPRFVIVDAESGAYAAFSNPDQVAWSEGTQVEAPCAPILLYSTKAHVKALEDAHLLRPLLFIIQEAVAGNFVGVRAIKSGCRLKLSEELGDDLILWGGETRAIVKKLNSDRSIGRTLRHSRCFTLEVPSIFDGILKVAVGTQMIEEAVRTRTPQVAFDVLDKVENIDEHQGALDYFSWMKHVAQFDTTYPVEAGGTSISFFVPWLRLGGVELCVINICRRLKALKPSLRIYLVITQENIAEIAPLDYEVFDEIIPLGHMSWERRLKACELIANSTDLAVNAHSAAAYAALDLRDAKPSSLRFGRVVSYLHVIDHDHFGKLTGYCLEAADRDSMLDAHVVISEQLAEFLSNSGVSPKRIRVGKNAPVVQPKDISDALLLAQKKAEAQRTGLRPLQVLFAGRLDYQKGLPRLLRVIELALEQELNVEFTIVGSTVLSGSHSIEWPSVHCRVLPATTDSSLLQQYYVDADVFMLLSRWEGMPLSILDAMAHAAVVIATDVGAVSETITDSWNGHLVGNGDDDLVAQDAVERLRRLLEDESGCLETRKRAVDTAFSWSWTDTAGVFLRLAENPKA